MSPLPKPISQLVVNFFDSSEEAAVFKDRKVSKEELELAVTVILVDLASCDQNFDTREYNVISEALSRLFNTSTKAVQSLVTQAQQILSNLRGPSGYAALLRKHLTVEERKKVFESIDKLILSDGYEDGFEIYLRDKFLDLLGISE